MRGLGEVSVVGEARLVEERTHGQKGHRALSGGHRRLLWDVRAGMFHTV